MRCDDVAARLGAYLDGELSGEAAEQVRQHLEDCPACARRQEQAFALAAAIRAEVPYYHLGGEARNRIRQAVAGQALARQAPTSKAPETARRPTARGWLAVAASLVLGIAGGWGLGARHVPAGPESALSRDVLAGHVRSLMADHLTDVASSDRHTVKPWFDGKLDFSPPVHDLAGQGFPLIGGRLDYLAGRSVAALAYGRNLHVINLFVWPSSPAEPTGSPEPDGGTRSESRQGYALLHWRHGGMDFWVASDLNPAELGRFVALLQQADRPGAS
jgi:anti-sigma factor RsiW